MVQSKYIIKNCPAFAKGIFCKGGDIIDDGCADKTLDRNTLISCQYRTDCLLKQIVELCKKEIRVYRKTLLPNDGTNTLHFGRQSLAYDILKLLDIQEVE